MLTLPIKRNWFDMIASGEKKEEYRNCTKYYKSRFEKYAAASSFKIRFRAGYKADSPLMECEVSLYYGRGREEWGALPSWIGFILKIHTVEVLIPNDIRCRDCEYLMFSDCYGECSKAYKGIVQPDDSCGKGKLR